MIIRHIGLVFLFCFLHRWLLGTIHQERFSPSLWVGSSALGSFIFFIIYTVYCRVEEEKGIRDLHRWRIGQEDDYVRSSNWLSRQHRRWGKRSDGREVGRAAAQPSHRQIGRWRFDINIYFTGFELDSANSPLVSWLSYSHGPSWCSLFNVAQQQRTMPEERNRLNHTFFYHIDYC